MTWIILIAVSMDLLMGDPNVRWHPVRWIGRWIEFAENILRKIGWDGYAGGILLTISTILACSAPALLIWKFSGPIKIFAGAGILYFSIALGQLIRESRRIRSALERGRLDDARIGVSGICGRDTLALDADGLSRATIESVSENTVDGFTAPLFYAALFGPVGAWVYRIVNTLDSMVGHKDEKYSRFGWASARLDDALNFIPARLTALIMAIASPLIRGKIGSSIKTVFRFSRLHPSPNAGWPESAAAGALGIRLGGPAFYSGELTDKPYLGDGPHQPSPTAIGQINRLAVAAGLIFAAACLIAA